MSKKGEDAWMKSVTIQLTVAHEGSYLIATNQVKLPMVPATGDWVFCRGEEKNIGFEVERRSLDVDSSEVWISVKFHWASSLAKLSVFEVAEFLIHNGWELDQKWLKLYTTLSSPSNGEA